ncbi:MAG: hypothetical protein HDS78_03380 [Bacteroidales bacterium]|nr:hypothetical protein [Bacteroidales bacterium]
MNKNDFEKEILDQCRLYGEKADPGKFIESLTILTQAYMDQCGLSLTYRTLVEAAGQHWLELLQKSNHPIAQFAREHSFTGVMPYLSEEFNARKEHYWEYDVCCPDSEEVIAAIPSIMDEYDHAEQFKIAFCAGIIPYIAWLKEFEITRDEILGK